MGLGAGLGFGFGGAWLAAAGAVGVEAVGAVDAAGAATGAGSGAGCVAGFHALVVWQVSQALDSVVWSGSFTLARSGSWHAMQSCFVARQVAGSPRWHQKHLTCCSVSASDLSAATVACAPVSAQNGWSTRKCQELSVWQTPHVVGRAFGCGGWDVASNSGKWHVAHRSGSLLFIAPVDADGALPSEHAADASATASAANNAMLSEALFTEAHS